MLTWLGIVPRVSGEMNEDDYSYRNSRYVLSRLSQGGRKMYVPHVVGLVINKRRRYEAG